MEDDVGPTVVVVVKSWVDVATDVAVAVDVATDVAVAVDVTPEVTVIVAAGVDDT